MVNALASQRCDPGSIPAIGKWDGHVVTKSDGWVSSEYSGFLPHEDSPNANIGANEHDCFVIIYKYTILIECIRFQIQT